MFAMARSLVHSQAEHAFLLCCAADFHDDRWCPSVRWYTQTVLLMLFGS